MNNRKDLPQESLVRIFVNGDFLSAVLCTPRDVKELAVGWLYGQSHIRFLSDIASLAACEELHDVHVYLAEGHTIREDTGRMIRTSACMGGEISQELFLGDTPRQHGGPRISLGALRSLMWKTLSAASSYRETGGIHCAAIASATDEKPIAIFEDVGRHNAFDKAIGRMLLASLTSEGKILLTSGRISSEMALKAAHSRIAVVATITTGTDLAVRIAEDAGLTLVARVLNASPQVLCGKERILYNEEPI